MLQLKLPIQEKPKQTPKQTPRATTKQIKKPEPNQTNKTANKPRFRRDAEHSKLNKSYTRLETGPSHPKHCMPLIIHSDPWLLMVYLGRQRTIILTSFSKAF